MFKTVLKFAFALTLVFWLIQSGKLDFTLVGKSFDIGIGWLIALLIFVLQITLTAFRFKLIIDIKAKKPIPFFEIIKFNWIGLFFSSILPGAVTGDFIKLFYMKKADPSLTKGFLLTAVLLDRVLGLLALLFVSGVFSLMYYAEITSISPSIIHIIKINFLLFSGGLAVFIILFSTKKIQKFLMHLFFKIPLVGKKIVENFEHIFTLNKSRSLFFKCFVLSIFTQLIFVFAFYLLTSPFYTVQLPLPYAFTFIPFGLIALAIPISPAGLGVGHALFQNLFSLVGITNGASLFNLFYLANLSISLLGFIPYLLAGKKPTDSEIKEFS